MSIKVIIKREEFIKAIQTIAESNVYLAKALTPVAQVVISDCRITSNGVGIQIGDLDDSMEEAEFELGEG